MVENANAARKFIANACLHQQLGFARSFLRRNLRRILDAQERLCQPKPDHATPRDMVANERNASGWDYPTKEMLVDLTKGDKPVLRLDALHMRHPNSRSRKRKRTPRDDDQQRADWLPDPLAEGTWPCQVNFLVRARETQSSKRTVYMESRAATISRYQQTNEEHSHFEIALVQPFLMEVGKLFVPVETGTNGSRTWRRTTTASYILEVSIHFHDSDDTADVLSVLESQPRARYEQIPAVEGILRMVWEELPQCPPATQAILVKRAKGHSIRDLEYGMQLSMGWTRRRDSPLETYNRAFHRTRTRKPQLLTPTSDCTDKATKYVVTYQFRDAFETRSKRVEGLQCPLCRERPKSFARLILHFTTFHDHFRFDAEDPQDDPDEDASTVSKTIVLSLAPQQYDKMTGQGSEVRCNWIAPNKPFDLQAYLDGDDSWTGFSKAKAVKRRGKQANALPRETQHAIAPRAIISRPAPEKVQDLPQKGSKKHVVPDVPGVRFYHTLSKKPIAPGEMISDSDESVDEFWMENIQRHALKELSINGAAQDFTIAFNRHLAREQSTSSVLMKEAMVRFTREHRKELQDVGWQRSFRQKLEQLQKAGVINRLTITHCIQLMQATYAGEDVEMTNGADEASTVEVANASNGPPHGISKLEPERAGTSPLARSVTPSEHVNGEREPAHPNGDIKMKDAAGASKSLANGFHEPARTGGTSGDQAVQQKRHNICVCGTSARDTRAAVICSNVRCQRKDFHLACVGLQKRLAGWQCAGCSAA